MRFSDSTECLCGKVSEMNRSEVTDCILHYQGRVKLDFTSDYLEELSLDKLRHILLAAMLTD